MHFGNFGPVSPGKIQELKRRLDGLKISLPAVEEQFTKGGGHGGQKINKTSNRVVLRYAPMDLVVSCQRERERSLNRFLALRELVDEIEFRVSPDTSGRRKEWEKICKQKDRQRRRQQAGIDNLKNRP